MQPVQLRESNGVYPDGDRDRLDDSFATTPPLLYLMLIVAVVTEGRPVTLWVQLDQKDWETRIFGDILRLGSILEPPTTAKAVTGYLCTWLKWRSQNFLGLYIIILYMIYIVLALNKHSFVIYV